MFFFCCIPDVYPKGVIYQMIVKANDSLPLNWIHFQNNFVKRHLRPHSNSHQPIIWESEIPDNRKLHFPICCCCCCIIYFVQEKLKKNYKKKNSTNLFVKFKTHPCIIVNITIPCTYIPGNENEQQASKVLNCIWASG